jgi:hypothetical protein
VIADLTDVGSVGITSDLSANGFQTDVDGAASVEVGPLNGPGGYAVRFTVELKLPVVAY